MLIWESKFVFVCKYLRISVIRSLALPGTGHVVARGCLRISVIRPLVPLVLDLHLLALHADSLNLSLVPRVLDMKWLALHPDSSGIRGWYPSCIGLEFMALDM